MVIAVDLACAAAFWEDENYHYEKAKEKAGEEAVAIGKHLDDIEKKAEER